MEGIYGMLPPCFLNVGRGAAACYTIWSEGRRFDLVSHCRDALSHFVACLCVCVEEEATPCVLDAIFPLFTCHAAGWTHGLDVAGGGSATPLS